MKKSLIVILFSVLICALAVSCLNEEVHEAFDTSSLPDMIMRNATYTMGRSDGNPIVMTASEIEIYNEKDSHAFLSDVSFSRDDISGSCNRAEITNDNTIAKLSGNICFSSVSDDITIKCEDLVLDEEIGKISTDGEVFVYYGDGTQIHAKGFKAEPGKDNYEFNELMEGYFEEV